MSKETIFQRSVDTDVIIKALEARPVGAVVTYEELSAMTGRARARLGNILRTAVKALWGKELYWLVVVGVGVKRVDENEALFKPMSRRDRVKRQALMARSELRPINFASLTSEQKMAHTATTLAMAVHKAAETPKARQRLLEAVATIEKKLSMQDAAKALLGAKRKAN